MICNQYGSVARPQVRRAAFTNAFNAVEVRAVRPEDKNARQIQQTFANGATLADLEQHIAFLRALDRLLRVGAISMSCAQVAAMRGVAGEPACK